MLPIENGGRNHKEQEVEPEEVIGELLGVEISFSGSWRLMSKGPVVEIVDQPGGKLWVAHALERRSRTAPAATWAIGVEPLMAIIIIIIIIIIISLFRHSCREAWTTRLKPKLAGPATTRAP